MSTAETRTGNSATAGRLQRARSEAETLLGLSRGPARHYTTQAQIDAQRRANEREGRIRASNRAFIREAQQAIQESDARQAAAQRAAERAANPPQSDKFTAKAASARTPELASLYRQAAEQSSILEHVTNGYRGNRGLDAESRQMRTNAQAKLTDLKAQIKTAEANVKASARAAGERSQSSSSRSGANRQASTKAGGARQPSTADLHARASQLQQEQGLRAEVKPQDVPQHPFGGPDLTPVASIDRRMIDVTRAADPQELAHIYGEHQLATALTALSTGELRRSAEAINVSTQGSRADLLARITAAATGGRYAGNFTEPTSRNNPAPRARSGSATGSRSSGSRSSGSRSARTSTQMRPDLPALGLQAQPMSDRERMAWVGGQREIDVTRSANPWEVARIYGQSQLRAKMSEYSTQELRRTAQNVVGYLRSTGANVEPIRARSSAQLADAITQMTAAHPQSAFYLRDFTPEEAGAGARSGGSRSGSGSSRAGASRAGGAQKAATTTPATTQTAASAYSGKSVADLRAMVRASGQTPARTKAGMIAQLEGQQQGGGKSGTQELFGGGQRSGGQKAGGSKTGASKRSGGSRASGTQGPRQLVPIKELPGYQLDASRRLDPYFVREYFGDHQLRTAMEIQTKNNLREAVSVVEERHPGTAPSGNASKKAMIDYILKYVTGQ